MPKGTVTLVGLTYLVAKTANFGVLEPNFRRWDKIAVLGYYVTKQCYVI